MCPHATAVAMLVHGQEASMALRARRGSRCGAMLSACGVRMQLPAAWDVAHAEAVSAWSAGYLLHFMLYGQPPKQLQAQMQGGLWTPSRFMEAMASADEHGAWLPSSAPFFCSRSWCAVRVGIVVRWRRVVHQCGQERVGGSAGNEHGAVTHETRRAMRAMLTAPGLHDGSLTRIKETAWLRAGLPCGVDRANAVCVQLSEARRCGQLARNVALEVRRAMRAPLSMPPPDLSRTRCLSGAPEAAAAAIMAGPWLREVQRAASKAGTHGLSVARAARARRQCAVAASALAPAPKPTSTAAATSALGRIVAKAIAGRAAQRDAVATACRQLALAAARLPHDATKENVLRTPSAEKRCSDSRGLKRKAREWPSTTGDDVDAAMCLKAPCTVPADSQQECSAC